MVAVVVVRWMLPASDVAADDCLCSHLASALFPLPPPLPPPSDTQIFPNSHLSHFFLGIVNTKQGRFDDAISNYEVAVFYNPQFFPAVMNLGSVNLIAGHVRAAAVTQGGNLPRDSVT